MGKRKLTKEERRDRDWAKARERVQRGGMRIENPFDFPGYVYIEPPGGFDATWRRGGPWFDMLADVGYNVGRYREGAGVSVKMYRPWTILYQMVSHNDVREQVEGIKRSGACVIMDCHFPIMRLEETISDNETFMGIVETRPIMLENMRTACAVTAPREDWAVDLAGEIPNVYYLPDIGTPEDLEVFGSKFAGICASLMRGARDHVE